MPLFSSLPAPWLLQSGEPKSSAATTLTDNTTYLTAIELLAPVTITGFRYRATSATGTYDIGIFDANGNLLTHTGVNNVASGVVLINLGTAYSLSPGRYFLGYWTAGAGTGNVFVASSTAEDLSNVAQVTATNAGGLQSFSGLGALTMPAPNRVALTAVVSGGLS